MLLSRNEFSSGPPKLYACPRCEQKFGHPRSIHRHLKACEGKFDFECEVCKKRFYRLDALKLHAQKHASMAIAPIFNCDVP